MKPLGVLLLLVSVILLFRPGVLAGYPPTEPNCVQYGVLASGGNEVSDSTTIMLGTLGQPLMGLVESFIIHEAGFWYYLPDLVATSVTMPVDEPPLTYRLDQNYPNPFNPSTTIQYALPKRSYVSLKVYNVLGREVATLVNQELEPGIHRVTFDAQRVASGVYFYRISAEGFSEVKKLVILK